MIPNIPRAGRNLRRAHDVLRVLVRYGFSDVVQELGLDRALHRGRRTLRLERADAEIIREPRAVRLRRALEELGPTFIKFGQILSTRPDLIPRDWVEEFSKLQDDVAQLPGKVILDQIRTELGEKVDTLFASIEPEALAAASIAQVHRARLRDGTEVVLKVLRPGIRRVINADLELMEFLAQLVERHFEDLGFSPVEAVDQFRREIRREMDYTIEARATERMREDFADDPNIDFPRVFHEASTHSVLCQEYVHGRLLSRTPVEEFSSEERLAIVRNGTHAVFRQCLEIGFFHADPHPGNIIVRTDEHGRAGPITFIDCGMTGHIDPKTAEHLADIVQGTISGDLDRVIDVVIAMTDADPMIAMNRAFRADVWEFIGYFQNITLGSLHMGRLLQEFFDKLQRHRLRCPADIVFLIKALTTIEGVGESICPEFDIIAEARPSLEKLLHRRYSLGALRMRVQNSMIAYAEMAEDIPRQFKMLLTAAHRHKLTLNLQHRGLHDVTRTVEHASRNISRALVITALLVASSVLILADKAGSTRSVALQIGAWVGFSLAALIAIWSVTLGRNP